MQRVAISLCMIVKNEEKYLHKCLESVRGLVDEIIIVDTGSTDAPREIAALAVREQMWKEALTFYDRLLNLKKECPNYQKIYAVQQQMNDCTGIQATVVEVKKRFPHSIWAEQPDLVGNA